jgi:hypothetical protein
MKIVAVFYVFSLLLLQQNLNVLVNLEFGTLERFFYKTQKNGETIRVSKTIKINEGDRLCLVGKGKATLTVFNRKFYLENNEGKVTCYQSPIPRNDLIDFEKLCISIGACADKVNTSVSGSSRGDNNLEMLVPNSEKLSEFESKKDLTIRIPSVPQGKTLRVVGGTNKTLGEFKVKENQEFSFPFSTLLKASRIEIKDSQGDLIRIFQVKFVHMDNFDLFDKFEKKEKLKAVIDLLSYQDSGYFLMALFFLNDAKSNEEKIMEESLIKKIKSF